MYNFITFAWTLSTSAACNNSNKWADERNIALLKSATDRHELKQNTHFSGLAVVYVWLWLITLQQLNVFSLFASDSFLVLCETHFTWRVCFTSTEVKRTVFFTSVVSIYVISLQQALRVDSDSFFLVQGSFFFLDALLSNNIFFTSVTRGAP